MNICCGYSLKVPCQGVSNEYPQHIFSWRIKKNINTFGLKKKKKTTKKNQQHFIISYGINTFC